jgi:hypothetical protein
MEPGGELAGYMGIDVGGDNAAMADYIFDDADILAVLQKECGVGMPQRMD